MEECVGFYNSALYRGNIYQICLDTSYEIVHFKELFALERVPYGSD